MNTSSYPTPWTPFAGGDMEHRQIAPKEFECRYVSKAAADRAIARLVADPNVRECDRCGRLLGGGHLCGKCSRVETTPEELTRLVAQGGMR